MMPLQDRIPEAACYDLAWFWLEDEITIGDKTKEQKSELAIALAIQLEVVIGKFIAAIPAKEHEK